MDSTDCDKVIEVTREVIILKTISITALMKAREALFEVLQQPYNVFIRDASIKRFEFTFELAWKILKKVLEVKGLEANSPREIFREAAKEHLIEGPESWFMYLEKRNLTSHVYKEKVAEEVFGIIETFAKDVDKLIEKLKKQ